MNTSPYSDDPRWQLNPTRIPDDAVNAPLIARYLWYWRLTDEERARVDAGLSLDETEDQHK